MKIKNILIASMTCVLVCGCLAKEKPVCNLTVSLEKDTYRVGEEVVFKFDGHSDNIVFFSGEPGHVYDNKDATFRDNPMMVKFRTFTDGAYDTNCQFLVSCDFSGIYDKDNVAAATWTEYTDDFGFTTGPNMDSNELDLKSLLPEDIKEMENPSIYLAFRYYDKDPEKPVSNRWCIRSISVKYPDVEGKMQEVANMSSMGWTLVNCGSISLWSVGSQLLAQGTTTAIYQTKGKDEWVISKAFTPNKVAPDSGEIIKFISVEPDKYAYVYDKPGTYEVVFDCSSVWYNGSAYKVIRKTITITE